MCLESYVAVNLLADFILLGAVSRALGLFSLRGERGVVPVSLPDGVWRNTLDGSPVPVECGLMASDGEPIVIITDA